MHSVVLALTVLGCNTLLYWEFAPYDWGLNSSKRFSQEFQRNRGRYNVLFFGNSRVEHQIDPKVFDASVQDVYPSHSYNLGIPAQGAFEQYYYYPRVMDYERLKPDFVLLQLVPFFPGGNQQHTSRAYYWMNWDVFRIMAPLYSVVHFPGEHRWLALAVVTRNYVQRLMNMNVWNWVIAHGTRKYPSDLNRGYRALPLHPGPDHDRIEQHTNFTGSTSVISRMIESDCSRSDAGLFYGVIEDLIEMSIERNVHPLFLYPPPSSGSRMYCVFQMIPEEYKIPYPKIEDFPDLYRRENFFDQGHFNERGAEIYTKYLAEEFTKWLSRTNTE